VCKFLLQRTGSLSLEELAAKSSKSFGECNELQTNFLKISEDMGT